MENGCKKDGSKKMGIRQTEEKITVNRNMDRKKILVFG